MIISTADHIAELIRNDLWRMNILHAVASLDLPDWAIGAGFVRAAVWDAITDKGTSTPLPDVDVIYFDCSDRSPERDMEIAGQLHRSTPAIDWDVKNQARMHLRNNDTPYANTEAAVARWLETPTCIAARLENNGDIRILAPHGLDDLLSLHVRATEAGREKPDEYMQRMISKNWAGLWPGLWVEELT